MKGEKDNGWRGLAQDVFVRLFLSAARLLPYRLRVPLSGWVFSRLIAPIAGWRQRIADNLAHVAPDLGPDEVRRIQRQVPDNAGRTFIEIFSGAQFTDRVARTPLDGPGAAAFAKARAANRPVILVTAHFGNYDAPRAALIAQGHPLAALYRPMRNTRFNEQYVPAISKIGEPVFPTDRRGVMNLIRHLSGGGIIGILVDVYATDGAELSFFGKPARTATSAAVWALKYDAVMIPIYGIRSENGLDFGIFLDDPIPPSDPETMTQALNDSLERLVRRHMGQWFWIHRRWDVKYAA